MSDSVFVPEGDGFMPTELARGPWDPGALHGGAPAALIMRAFERHDPSPAMRFARLGFELLRPVPFAPLLVSVQTLRPGRRVQELAAEMFAQGAEGDVLICRANALRVLAVPEGLPAAGQEGQHERMPGPEQGRQVRFALSGDDGVSFAGSAMEIRFLDDPLELGPGRVWMRLGHPLLPGEELSPLQRVAASADFGNGISASLPFEDHLFINADLSVHLHREPRGEWIGLDARTLLEPGGAGLSETVLHDEDGPVGRGFQALVVGRR